ncbi:hypothetical protein MC885_021296, partial [Smutsia gigantea]
ERGDSGRGPGAGILPAAATAQRRLCSLHEGRAAASAQRPCALRGDRRLGAFGASADQRDGAKEERADLAPAVADFGLRASPCCHPDPRSDRFPGCLLSPRPSGVGGRVIEELHWTQWPSRMDSQS